MKVNINSYGNSDAFGIPVDMSVVNKNKNHSAKIFAEGNVCLEALLLDMWKNGIDTHACCCGHEKIKMLYFKDRFLLPSVAVGEDEYFANKNSKRYHCRTWQDAGYISFKIDSMQAREIKTCLNKCFSDNGINAYVSLDPINNIVSVHKRSYGGVDAAELFFECIRQGLRDIGILKS